MRSFQNVQTEGEGGVAPRRRLNKALGNQDYGRKHLRSAHLLSLFVCERPLDAMNGRQEAAEPDVVLWVQPARNRAG